MSWGVKEMRLVRAGQVWEDRGGDILLVLSVDVSITWMQEVVDMRLLSLMTGDVYNPLHAGRETTERVGWTRVS